MGRSPENDNVWACCKSQHIPPAMALFFCKKLFLQVQFCDEDHFPGVIAHHPLLYALPTEREADLWQGAGRVQGGVHSGALCGVSTADQPGVQHDGSKTCTYPPVSSSSWSHKQVEKISECNPTQSAIGLAAPKTLCGSRAADTQICRLQIETFTFGLFWADFVDLLHLPGGRSHLASAGPFATDPEYRQFDGQLRLSTWVWSSLSRLWALACNALSQSKLSTCIPREELRESQLKRTFECWCSCQANKYSDWDVGLIAQEAGSLHRTGSSCRRTYRGLYILNWIWRFFHEPRYRQWIGIYASVLSYVTPKFCLGYVS